MHDPAPAVPLLVDLDGTLVDGDTLHLSIARIVRRRPWLVPVLPFVVLRGRARFKEFVSEHSPVDASALPYRRDVLEFAKRERQTGRTVVLATAANQRIARAVAEYLGIFDFIIASDEHHNAKGDGKVTSIRAALGGVEFDYVGDSMSDVPVFRVARRSYLVSPTPELTAAVADCHVAGVFASA